MPDGEKTASWSTDLYPTLAGGAPRPLLAPPGYRLLRELGRGGMGVVYEALHETTDRRMAVKMIIPAVAVAELAMQMFLREASVLSQLAHRHIVRFRELGLANGQVFLAMDYVETVDPRQLLARWPAAQRVRVYCAIACQVMSALEHTHQLGLVHRDIKPTNILVARAGKKLEAKLADFGLAKSYETAGMSGLTQEGEVRGTLAFMAPEQFLDSLYVKPAADLYAVGATLYYYLSGRFPYQFTSIHELRAVLQTHQPTPLGRYCPDLPAGLSDVIQCAIAKEPSARFATAAEMRRALLRFAKPSGDAPR